MNVGDALHTAASMEAHYYVQYGRQQDNLDNFGHPETPRMALHKLSDQTNSNDIYLLVAYSKHCVTAQLLSPFHEKEIEISEDIISIGTVVSPSLLLENHENGAINELPLTEVDESITALIVVELENPGICSNTTHTPAKGNENFLIAVVLGTNRGRLFTSEITIQQKEEAFRKECTSHWTLECTSVQYGDGLLEVLPHDNNAVVESIRRKNKQLKTVDGSPHVMVPFQPHGAISGLYCSYDVGFNHLETKSTYVWITFSDGNLVRMHHAALFPSVWAAGVKSNLTVDDLLFRHKHTALLRCQIKLPPGEKGNLTSIPLPRYYPSPLAPINFEDVNTSSKNICFEALVFGRSDSFPTLCIYTSEDQFWEPQPAKVSDSLMVDVVLGGTKAIVGGVVGALRWATGSEQTKADSGSDNAESIPSTPFPSIWNLPVSLFAGSEFHDVPRVIEHVAISPDGAYAALSDGLGRVLLFDLSLKQIIRMWKGLRQASCTWSTLRESHPSSKTKNFLVIHSKQRRVVEVWPCRSGDRLASFQVSRDTFLVACSARNRNQQQEQENHFPEFEHDTFVLDSIDPAQPATILKKVDVDTLRRTISEEKTDDNNDHQSRSREATMRVQHLKQLLSVEEDVMCYQDEVFDALCRIKSLNDLSLCLDILAKATVLEEQMCVQGSSFQKRVLKYCAETLCETTKEVGEGLLTGAAANLSHKIEFYSRIIKAFDIIKGYEDASLDEGTRSNVPISNFAREAIGWASASETVTGSRIDKKMQRNEMKNLRFYHFASSCVFPEDGKSPKGSMKIFLSESTRTRLEILVFLFRPLLGWFSSGVVGSVFDALGIREEFSYTVKCFGEWFMTLPIQQIQDRCLTLPDSPMNRFLRDTVEREFNAGVGTPTSIDALSQLCERSTDLIRAFMLGTLSREVQHQVSRQKEDAAFVTADISKWCALVKHLDHSKASLETLLRKIRMCLLISLRLHGEDLAPFPLSVTNIEQESSTVSVYKWIALDELSISHNQEEIATIETACRIGTHSFDPFSPEVDEPERFRLLQKACETKAKQIRAADHTESLLLFLGAYNQPFSLAAHRSLLLALEWIKEPKYLQVMRHAMDALRSLESSSMTYAVRVEVWSRFISPMYRAHLFGFSDTPDIIKEDEVAPLLENREWASEFGGMALEMLKLIEQSHFDQAEDPEKSLESPNVEGRMIWPVVTFDHTLSHLRRKARMFEPSAVNLHIVAVCALLFSDDRQSLSECVPGIEACFQPESLFDATNVLLLRDLRQEKFLRKAIVVYAQNLDDRPIDNFGLLSEHSELCARWGFEKRWLQTTFLIVMYELGKDKNVDDLMVAAGSQVLPEQMVVAGVNIVCQRINFYIKKAKSRGITRNILGLLDAELCEWIHKRAESAKPLASYFVADVSLNNTKILSLRLLSLASTSNEDDDMRGRIHALSVLTGTLVQAIESNLL